MKKSETSVIATGDSINGQSVVIAAAVKTFQSIKEDVIERCKEKSACQSEFKKVVASKTLPDLLQILKNNMTWCLEPSIQLFNAAWLEDNFGTELLWSKHIYTSGIHEVRLSEAKAFEIYTLGSSTANVTSLGNSTVKVESRDSSTANVESRVSLQRGRK